eukprot:1042583-Prymnesium_polylepis.2
MTYGFIRAVAACLRGGVLAGRAATPLDAAQDPKFSPVGAIVCAARLWDSPPRRVDRPIRVGVPAHLDLDEPCRLEQIGHSRYGHEPLVVAWNA